MAKKKKEIVENDIEEKIIENDIEEKIIENDIEEKIVENDIEEKIIENDVADATDSETVTSIEETPDELAGEKKKETDVDIEEKVNLRILIAFTDKYTDVDYKYGDIIPFEEERANELLKDKRRLVEIAK